MNSGAFFRALLVPFTLGLGVAPLACDTAGPADTGGEGDEDPETNPSSDIVAIEENFDAWDGGGERFFFAKPEGALATFEDNNTRAEIGGQTGLLIHAPTEDNSGYGFSAEIQIQLNQQTDLSKENFHISFDVYIPAETNAKTAHVQWAFYETTNYYPIYSKWNSELPSDTWTTITATIDATSGNVDYSGFPNDSDNPGSWIFDVVRIQGIINGEGVVEGDDILFYIDNLRVANF